jgi:citrate synthase
MVGSSHAGLFASISAGVSALWGPLHGGANQAVLEMLEEIHRTGGDADIFGQSQRQNDPFRLMGFGHRVYKISIQSENYQKQLMKCCLL